MELLGEVLAELIGLVFEPFNGLLVNDGFDIRQFAIECFFDRAHFLRKQQIIRSLQRRGCRGQIGPVEHF